MKKIVKNDTWFIAHNNEIYHDGFSPAGTCIETGLPHIEEFNSEEAWNDRKEELNITKPVKELELENSEPEASELIQNFDPETFDHKNYSDEEIDELADAGLI
jgi:hypothetical protein